jgi:hypothetical protein
MKTFRKSQGNFLPREAQIAILLFGLVLNAEAQGNAASVAAVKDHVLFVGTDLSVKQDGKFYHVVGANKKTLKIDKDHALAEVRLSDGANIRINKGVKLSNLSATIGQLTTESVDRESARAQLAAMQASMLLENEASDQEDRKHGLMTVLSGVGINKDSPSFKIFKEQVEAPVIKDYTESLPAIGVAKESAHTFLNESVMPALSADDELTFDASALPHLEVLDNPASTSLNRRVAQSSSIEVDLGFAISSPEPLDHPYIVVIANYGSPNKPEEVARQISARQFERIDSKPRQVKLTHAASLNGLPFRNFDIALFANGQEVATNLSEKRLALTSDQAFQFFLIDYLSTHKGATRPPTPMLMTPRAEFRRQLATIGTNPTIYANVDTMGNTVTISLERSGTKSVPASVESALRNVRFLPALNNGAPVDGQVKVTLAQLAN